VSTAHRTESWVDVTDGYRLWVESTGDPSGSTVLLVMGANASGLGWPDALVDRLAAHHHVVRYDHRDTGRSTHAFDERPYPLLSLADDAVAVLDALGVDRAHLVGMSMGGMLSQLLLVDRPERVASATLFGVKALDDEEAPGPQQHLLEMWVTMGEERSPDEDRAWQVEHARMLHGSVLPFDAEEVVAAEQRLVAHRGTDVGATAHARADQDGLFRDLAAVTAPVLVVDAPEDPVAPPPTAARLAARVPGARLVVVPGMAHALPAAVVDPLADVVLHHLARVDTASRRPT
jgi:pimeloyl-ACP methyl ester carboxylesterase